MEYQQLFIAGDILSQKMNFKMETPSFFLNYWKFVKFYKENEKDKSNTYQLMEKQNLKETIIKGNCQISLW